MEGPGCLAGLPLTMSMGMPLVLIFFIQQERLMSNKPALIAYFIEYRKPPILHNIFYLQLIIKEEYSGKLPTII